MKKYMKRSISALLAATFVCTNCVAASGIDLRRFKSYDEDDMVSVFVSVEGQPVLAGENAAEMGTDYLSTQQAQNEAAALEEKQADAQGYIESFYPDLETTNNYTELVNGFTCDVPQELVDDIEECPQVTAVRETQLYFIPKLINADEMGNADVYKETTGLYGDGETVAVIDTELDITHDMFSAIDDVDVQFTKEDIADFIANNQLNADCTVDDVYVSSKLPFVYSYTNYDNHFEVADEAAYHGTHVCGIAAGNQVTDDNGNTFSGIAPNAQIVFMDVFEYYEDLEGYAASDYMVVSAMEDAAKLGVSVMNLSLGSDNEDTSVYDEAVKNAENAGIIVCAAAGNTGSGAFENSPQNVDNSTVNSPSTVDGVVSCASCDNNYVLCNDMKLANSDEKIVFSEINSFSIYYSGRAFNYVYCGNGNKEDFEGLDLSGKLALCDLSSMSLDEVSINAAYIADATGVIICDNVDETLKTDFNADYVIGAFVTKADGERLKNDPVKKIRIGKDMTNVVSTATVISNFSSYGVSENLVLKPDITGVGGNVYSAAYNNGYDYMSGTSMATPYMSGCFMLADQSVKISNPQLVGKEKNTYLKNMLMNSAKPVEDNDTKLYYSPRIQGAGLVSLSNFINDKVLMTGTEGEAKINLFDNLSDSFTMPVTITNNSSEDVNFTDAKLLLTTDSTKDGEWVNGDVIYSEQALECDYDLSELTTVSANSSSEVNVNVTLNPAQTAQIKEIFTNGFFVEGYIMLCGAENCCDISIPIMGFYGDWADVPIFDKILTDESSVTVDNVPATSMFGTQFPLGINLQILNKIKNEEDITELTYYISPNNDGCFDSLYYNLSTLRESVETGMRVYDKDKNIVANTDYLTTTARYTPQQMFGIYDISNLEEGTYTAEIYGHINYKGAENHIQTTQFEFTVDKTAPEIISKKTTVNKDGRKILEMKVSDEKALNGIVVLGNGTGGIEGEYDPKNPNEGETDIMDFLSQFINGETFDGEAVGSLAKSCAVKSVLEEKGIENDDDLENDYSFVDLIVPDDENNCTFRYDVTDFENYDFMVLDCAYNMSEYAGNLPTVERITVGNQVLGEKLSLKTPIVDSTLPLTKACWQVSFDGKEWQDFDTETIMTNDYNGAYIRYYAENSEGFNYSNRIKLKLADGKADNNSSNTNSMKNVSTLTTSNPATGGTVILFTSAALLGLAVVTKRKKK